MKRVMISMGLAVALTMSAFAQDCDRKGGKEKCEFPGEQMVKELNLSNEQAAKLKAADEAFSQEAKAVREKQQQAMDVCKEEMNTAQERRQAALKSTLTQEQYIKYLEMKLQRMERHPGKDMKGMKEFHRKGDGKAARMMDRSHRPFRGDSIGAKPRRMERK